MSQEELWKQMAELTEPECAHSCRVLHSCCSVEYCNMADALSKERGIEYQHTDHSTLPFMGSDGCIVAPHNRPLCTLHTCDILAWGFKRGNPDWTEKYWTLRDRLMS